MQTQIVQSKNNLAVVDIYIITVGTNYFVMSFSIYIDAKAGTNMLGIFAFANNGHCE
jgi:hypothetical protein